MQFSGSGFSSLDPDSVDLMKYPEIAKVQWTYASLYPGDCIYIPSGISSGVCPSQTKNSCRKMDEKRKAKVGES